MEAASSDGVPFKISAIIIPEDRFREKATRIESLAMSMANPKVGQMYPIIVRKDGDKHILIDGRRRLEAAKKLGWSMIKVIFREEMDALSAKELELEADIQREQLTWIERSLAVGELHALKIKQFGAALPGRFSGGWSMKDTADAVKMSYATVQQDVILSEALKKYPELRSCQTRREALRLLATMNKERHSEANIQKLRLELAVSFRLGNWIDDAEEPGENVVDFVLTDISEYSANIVLPPLIKTMTKKSHGYLFIELAQFPECVKILTDFGFSTSKSPHIVNLKGQEKYLTFIWFGIGVTQPLTLKPIYTNQLPDDVLHPKDKPYSLLFYLIGTSGEATSLIFDPFAYGGLTFMAAHHHKKNCIAFCNAPEVYEQALGIIVKNQLGTED